MPRNTIDLETTDGSDSFDSGYALEPWRVRLGQAWIASLHLYTAEGEYVEIVKPTRQQLIELLDRFAGQEMVAHNGLFDVAWLISSIESDKKRPIPDCVKKIRWRCSMLLAEWVTNGRLAEDMRFSVSLVNLIQTYFKGQSGVDEFVAIKQGVVLDPNNDYWKIRGQLDAMWTQRLYDFLLDHLPKPSWRGYVIEQRSIPQLANSWLIGLYVDQVAMDMAEIQLREKIRAGCEELGLTPDVIGSPAQLGRVVFGQWGFPPVSKTPKGAVSTKADDFILLAFNTGDRRLLKVLEVKQALTLISKYIKTTREALARTGDGFIYGIPKMFGTSSGRLTYASETKGQKVSIAQHQLPRKDKLIRAFLQPPPGRGLWEADAASQESRIMGIWSKDPEIIRIFNAGINFHGYMAGQIYGRATEELMAAVKREDPIAIEQRQMGKLTNLSCNFRIGGTKLAKKSLTDYDTYMDENTGRRLVRTFAQTYSGVPQYWKNIVAFAKEYGFTYTLAQRRWKVPREMLAGSDGWKVEGTVISHPIQGTGGDMMYAALSQVPDAIMQTSLHDGQFFNVSEGTEGREEADYILDMMNKTPYQELWDLDEPLPIALEYEGTKVGRSFADVK